MRSCGCGSQLHPRAAPEATVRGEAPIWAGPVSSGTEKRESGQNRVARRLARTTQVQRLLGAPHPSHWGEGKETGRPRPAKVRDQQSVGSFFCVALFDN